MKKKMDDRITRKMAEMFSRCNDSASGLVPDMALAMGNSLRDNKKKKRKPN